MMTPDEIRDELRRRNLSIRDLADATGLNENHISKSLGKPGRKITVPEMMAIEAVLAPEPDRRDPIRTIPLLGEVPAGKFQLAEERGGRRVAVSDPDTPHNAYALTVKGDSMDLIVPDRSTLVIDPDDKALWPGDFYIIRSQDGETTFKEYQADPPRLVPCSSNPEHREMLIGAEPMVVVGKVFSVTLRKLVRRAG